MSKPTKSKVKGDRGLVGPKEYAALKKCECKQGTVNPLCQKHGGSIKTKVARLKAGRFNTLHARQTAERHRARTRKPSDRQRLVLLEKFSLHTDARLDSLTAAVHDLTKALNDRGAVKSSMPPQKDCRHPAAHSVNGGPVTCVACGHAFEEVTTSNDAFSTTMHFAMPNVEEGHVRVRGLSIPVKDIVAVARAERNFDVILTLENTDAGNPRISVVSLHCENKKVSDTLIKVVTTQIDALERRAAGL